MQDRGFIIKVSDILKTPGKKDEISFENKFTTNIPELTDDGIAGIVIIQSLDKNNILVSLENINCSINTVCGKCGMPFTKNFLVENFQGKFIMPSSLEKGEEKYDEDFFIDEKDENIDIEDLVTQSIVMSYPIIWECEKCKENDIIEDNYNYQEDENISEEFESGNTIQWIK